MDHPDEQQDELQTAARWKKMNRLFIATIIGLVLVGCGGGSSDKNNAPQPPAPEPDELAAQCSKNPAGSVAPGQDATATYTFNQSFDGTAKINTFCPGVLFGAMAIDIEGGQGSATVPVPEACEDKTLTMTMNVDGIDVSAQCAWNVSGELGETI